MRKQLLLTVLLGAAFAFGPGAHAQAPASSGYIVFTNTAEMDVDVQGADGKTAKKRVPVEKAPPGTQVIYTSTFKNTGPKPAGNIVVANAIPAHTTLVAGSTFGDGTDMTFSADGAKTWAAVDKVKVKGADGKERPAGISEFTHIRWQYRGELAPGKTGTVGFRVVIN